MGYRFFAQRAAHRIGVTGYAKNLSDGRVEVYAIGAPEQLDAFRAELHRGPQFASVRNVAEETAEVDSRYTDSFVIEHDSW